MAKQFTVGKSADNREYIQYGETNPSTQLVELAMSKETNTEISLSPTTVTTSSAHTLTLKRNGTAVGSPVSVDFTGVANTLIARRTAINSAIRDLATIALVVQNSPINSTLAGR